MITARKLKTVASLVTTKAAPGTEFKVGLEHIESWSGQVIPSDVEFEGDGVEFAPGDVLFGKLRPYLAKVWVADRPGAAVGDFLVLRPKPQIDSKFLFNALMNPDLIDRVSASVYGAKMPRASWDFLRGLEIHLPPHHVQSAVVRYLDRETAEIDAFIADQEELIALLIERRTTTVSRAVTGGIDSADLVSGVVPECLPLNWEFWPLTRIAPHRVDYRGATPTKVDDGTPLVTARNVRMGYIDYDISREYVAPEDLDLVMRRGTPKIGDILLTMEAPLGNVALIDRTDIALAQRIIKLRVAPAFDPAFVLYAMTSSYFQAQLNVRATGSTALGLKASKLAELHLLVPPLPEQTRIATELKQETSELDGAIADAREAIALSRERRAALISAAVTGKIDLNEHEKVA